MSTIDRTDLDSLPLQLAELLGAAIQIRMMLQSFRQHLVDDALPEFLALEQRVLDVEIQLRRLNIAHPITTETTSAQLARVLH
jgi:hypothetical protein